MSEEASPSSGALSMTDADRIAELEADVARLHRMVDELLNIAVCRGDLTLNQARAAWGLGPALMHP